MLLKGPGLDRGKPIFSAISALSQDSKSETLLFQGSISVKHIGHYFTVVTVLCAAYSLNAAASLRTAKTHTESTTPRPRTLPTKKLGKNHE